jgi:hypothetical protein
MHLMPGQFGDQLNQQLQLVELLVVPPNMSQDNQLTLQVTELL